MGWRFRACFFIPFVFSIDDEAHVRCHDETDIVRRLLGRRYDLLMELLFSFFFLSLA